MKEEIKVVSKEEILALFDQLLPWDKKEFITLLTEKYPSLFDYNEI